MRYNAQRDWDWSDGYLPEVRRILSINAINILKFEVASHFKDVTQATDMLIKTQGSISIAIRLRRQTVAYRDLTIRYSRPTQAPTEIHKIQEGYGDYYLYGWTEGMEIPEWMFIDLDALRRSGLLDRQKPIHNYDNSSTFIAIAYQALDYHDCILSGHINGTPVGTLEIPSNR